MIRLYGVFGSPFVRAVRIALAEKELAWEWAPFPLGAQKMMPYLALQPFGKIPAMDDGDFCLYETQAMLRYIDRAAEEPRLTPRDHRALARMDQLLGIVDCYLWPQVSRTIGFNRVIAPKIGVPVDERVVAEAIEPSRICLTAIATLQARGAYLVGDELTLADIAAFPHFDFLDVTPEGAALLAPHDHLRSWIARMRERKSVALSRKPPETAAAA